MAPTEPIATTPMAAPETDSGPSRLDRISQRAYEIYERRGGGNGREMEDWLQAEREIDGGA